MAEAQDFYNSRLVEIRRTNVLIVGGGLGGVAAALAATRRGASVILTEETDWLGGQLTTQGVPPDEHPWIEEKGCTASYRALREGIRAHYRAHFPLTPAARARPHLNPGNGTVSRLCHEPRAALAVIDELLRGVEVLREHQPTAVHVDGDRVEAVTLGDVTIAADWFVDATETGELLALCGAEHVTGAESRDETGEPHAAERADPLNMQPISVCFAVDHLEGEDHTIARPAGYEQHTFSLTAPDPQTNRPVARTLRPNPPGDPALIGPDFSNPDLDKDLWLFRRIAARGNFVSYPSDITLVNWPQIDYTGGPIYGVPDADEHLAAARELSLSFLHWLQTECGLPGLRLRGDVLGTDGLAKAPYVRESRRIKARHTIVEHELGRHYPDSVGIGAYRIDLHPSTGGDPYIDVDYPPYELPLGALIPVRVANLLPGAKNIGTTHITNGTYRVHLVEWNVGEVAGHLAAFCSANRTTPAAVYERPEAFQKELVATGVELRWT
jgi:glycine/D-amino acid oxidase-like deaminating enzyme